MNSPISTIDSFEEYLRQENLAQTRVFEKLTSLHKKRQESKEPLSCNFLFRPFLGASRKVSRIWIKKEAQPIKDSLLNKENINQTDIHGNTPLLWAMIICPLPKN